MTGSLADADIARALSALDHAMPAVSADTVIAAARARGAGTLAWRRAWPGAIVSGGLTVGAFALAAALMPGRVRDVIGRLTARHDRPQTVVAGHPLRGGVALVPRDSAEVDFQSAQLGGAVRITLGHGPALTVRGPMHGPRYRVSENRIVVSGVPTAQDTYDIEIPPAPATVLIRIGPHVVFAIATGRVVTQAARDAEGRYVIPLAMGAAGSGGSAAADAPRR
jgi:hypothetical protein